jgi:hypothetical protein
MAVSVRIAPTKTIQLEWDPKTHTILNPIQPPMGIDDFVTVAVTGYGDAMIKFLSPFGDEIATLKTGDVRQFLVGGIYQFNCYVDNQKATNGGGIEVIPHRP